MYTSINYHEHLLSLCQTRKYREIYNINPENYDYSQQIFSATFLDSFRNDHDIKPVLLSTTFLIDFLKIYKVDKSLNTGDYQKLGPLKSKDYYAACQHALNYGRKFNDYRPICILEDFIDEYKDGLAALFKEDQSTVTSNLSMIAELLHFKVNDDDLSQFHEEFTLHFDKLAELLAIKNNEEIDDESIFAIAFMDKQMQDIKSGKDTQRNGLKYLIRLSNNEPSLKLLAVEAKICYEILHKAGIDDFRAIQPSAQQENTSPPRMRK